MKDEIKIVAGNSNPRLVAEICEYLGVAASRADVGQFSDGEVQVEIRYFTSGITWSADYVA